jgi:hypothetical protein
MTEAILQADLQRELLRLTATFSSGDVTINDRSILDGANASAPYVVIDSADTFRAELVQSEWQVTWTIPFMLVVKFIDWDTSRTSLSTVRQTVLSALMDVNNYHDSSALLSWGIQSINAETPIGEIYDRYLEEAVEALPVFLAQRITLQVLEIRRN